MHHIVYILSIIKFFVDDNGCNVTAIGLTSPLLLKSLITVLYCYYLTLSHCIGTFQGSGIIWPHTFKHFAVTFSGQLLCVLGQSW